MTETQPHPDDLRATPDFPTPQEPLLLARDLAKSFYDPGRGEVRAVDGVDFALPAGVTALVGANGAGKSTLLRLVATLMEPDRGCLSLCGLDSRRDAAALRGRLGYLSTTTRPYPRLTARELLAYAGGFHGLSGLVLAARIATQAERFALTGFLDQRVGGLSTGQSQRLNLARVLLAEPTLLVLDEPTTGLDLVAADAFAAAIAAARSPQRLILIATHHLTEVERLADTLLVLRAGRVAYLGAPSALAAQTGRTLAESVLHLLRPADAQDGTAGIGAAS